MNRVTIESVYQAAERVSGAARRTPLLRVPAGDGVYVKAENLQVTGSFKIRGAYNFLASLDPTRREQGVVTHSSGNHAQGVAYAARLLGVEATIVIPDGAPPLKVERTRSHGATIVRCGNSSEERERVAGELVQSQGLTLVPPFDHPLIIAGQGTVGLEICQELPEVSNVLVPVGGGGLSAGVAVAVKALRPGARVIGVEPELAADAAESLAVGRRVGWPAQDVTRTVADGVRTQRIGELNFEILHELLDGIVTVSEEAILSAARWYPLQARLVVEPTGALTLAGYRKLVYESVSEAGLLPGRTVIVASGGNIDPLALGELLDPNR